MAASLETGINHVLSLDENSAGRLAQLDNRLVKLELEGIGITLYFAFNKHRVKVSLDDEREADTTVKGTPAALFAMAIPDGDGQWGTAGSRVQISGDATLARDLERLFSRLDPNWEGQISKWFGDVWGFQLASGLRQAAEQTKKSAVDVESMAADFLQRPESPVAQQSEVEEFAQSVDGLRNATDRLEARLRHIREKRSEKAREQEETE